MDKMKCFVSTAPFIWARKRWWYVNRRDLDWDMFMPFVERWNQTRVKLLVAFLLIMDKSIRRSCENISEDALLELEKKC